MPDGINWTQQAVELETTPGEAWIERSDGTITLLRLDRTGPASWSAHPEQGIVTVGKGDHLRVDKLWPGQNVTFDNVLAEVPPSS